MAAVLQLRVWVEEQSTPQNASQDEDPS
ncbi:uncharacterized protein G2W53_014220 [Senna tora]|uniref:Uncharacterized protein n=1 Tax=Senna tora TaxID=362788 RepID=A0A835C7L8_9FABA|nr:uncharacterized protein G2W53_014220 [Senna tora]